MHPVGLLLAILSAFFNGVFVAPGKLPVAKPVHPLVFNCYCSAGVLLSSLATAPFLPLVGARLQFTAAGALAGLIFVGASSLSFVAAASVGLSTGQGVWGGAAILVSFCWGTLGPAAVSRPVGSLPLSVLAVLLLILGVVGIVQCQSLGPRLLGRLFPGGARTVPTRAGFTEPLVNATDTSVNEATAEAGGASAAVSAAAGTRALGLAAAVAVGLFGGSILVPLSFLGDDFKGARALAFLSADGSA